MTSTGFNKHGVDAAGIHWGQYAAMTLMSLLIFFLALDKAVPGFHNSILSMLFKLQ
ncbi:hypothetical protein [Prochlorococcus marinus]|uniref:hypothetical protein n=1 Tax=Prochlorococcus marinus TaxID=1219 RepID=UPI0022B51B71|nr:hypothetical protein [Prochlorococcus marinus]